MTTNRAYPRELIVVYTLLAAMNVGAWLWALLMFRGRPVLLDVAVVVYGLGLRHAVDADHIAAIDNVTRKLFQDGRRSAWIGLWFALGHSFGDPVRDRGGGAGCGRLGRFQAARDIGGRAARPRRRASTRTGRGDRGTDVDAHSARRQWNGT